MKAVEFTQYGAPEVLRLVEKDKPIPKEDEVLIKIRATTVTAAEQMMRSGKPYWGRIILGLRRPAKKYRTLGMEFSGEIEKAGNSETCY